ncbi:MAG: adenosine kinase [Prevotellaceae bacterium]|jgi:sugar/nucleoside kinase (ribokinase family)|nr:adenosine kinase [Prevotellaceae bacterium]
MKRLLGIGNALVDVLAVLHNDDLLHDFNIPKGSMQHVSEATAGLLWTRLQALHARHVAGGSAANTVAGAARLGMPSAYIGKTGCDEPGRYFADDQAANGITAILLQGSAATGRCTVCITPDTERTMATYLGAAIELMPDDLHETMFAGYDYFHIEGYLVQNHDLVRRAVELAKREGLTVSLDLASYNVVEAHRDFLEDIVRRYVDVVFANEAEAAAFTGQAPRAAADALGKLCRIAVVKTGSSGSLVQSGGALHEIQAYPANAVDATGAGDLYAAGFLYGLATGLPLDRCGAIGAVVAAKVVEVVGTKISDDGWLAIKKVLQTI